MRHNCPVERKTLLIEDILPEMAEKLSLRDLLNYLERAVMNMSIADVDQKKFADILNKVNVAEMHDGDPKKVEEVLHEMIDYARDHFEVEEAHMLESAYPDYKQHKEEHRGYVLKTLSCLKREVSSDCQILNEIREYLKQWLLNHIQGTDKKYTEYLENSHYKN